MPIRHLLIDGSNFFMRAFHTKTKLNKQKQNVGAIQVTMQMLDRIVRHFNPQNVIMAWDIGKSKKRLEIFPEYKGQRKKMEPADFESMRWQRNECKEIFKLLPIRQIGVEGVEADDIIGFLDTKLHGDKVIVSNDRDFIQCIGRRTELFLPNKGILLNHKTINKFIGIPLEYFVIYKAIVGDASDNIAGIRGMGEKRTTKLINEGITRGKLDIPAEYEPIIKMNTALMNIGFLLDTEEKKKIIRSYKLEAGKKLQSSVIKTKFTTLGLPMLARSCGRWVAPYRKIVRR